MNKNFNKVIKGAMSNPTMKNFDMFAPECTTRPTKKYYTEQMRLLLYKVGQDDHSVVKFPIYIGLAWAAFNMTILYLLTGRKPNFSNRQLLTDYDRFFLAWGVKSDPDVHFNKRFGMYNSNSLCGMEILPKRPWEKFKDPENTMLKVAYKHNKGNPDFLRKSYQISN